MNNKDIIEGFSVIGPDFNNLKFNQGILTI